MKKQYITIIHIILCLALCIVCSGCGRDARTEETRTEAAGEQTTDRTAEEAGEPAADYHGLLRITEFSMKNSAGIRDEDGEFRDWIELENCSDSEVPLSGWTVTDLDGIGNVGPDMLNMLNNLMNSEIFRDRLLRRYAELVGTVLADDYVLARIDEYVALLRPEIARDHGRWGVTVEHWSGNVELLRSTIRDNDYAHYTVRDLCKRLDLTKEERLSYFGAYAVEGA